MKIEILPEIVMERRPLMNIHTAAYLRNLTLREALQEVEDGTLDPAWDIRCRDSRTACVRVLARRINGPVAEKEVYAWVPEKDPSPVVLMELFDCSREHIHNLIRDGLLLKLPNPKRSPQICRNSVLRFLQKRRIHHRTMTVSALPSQDAMEMQDR